jgi:hypothetical protein
MSSRLVIWPLMTRELPMVVIRVLSVWVDVMWLDGGVDAACFLGR